MLEVALATSPEPSSFTIFEGAGVLGSSVVTGGGGTFKLSPSGIFSAFSAALTSSGLFYDTLASVHM